MMASPLALRTPTCLACLRRTIQPARSPVLTQLRGKKTKSKLVVQLTEDIPGWGPQGNIIRISREAMRATWYPSGKMRYVTPDEFKRQGYNEDNITTRLRAFGTEAPEEVYEQEDFYDPLEEDMARLGHKPLAEVEQLNPHRALELLNQYIPATLTFERRLVHPNAAVKPTPEPAAEEAAATTTSTTTPTPEPKSTLTGFAARRAKIAQQQEAERQAAAAAKEKAAAAKKKAPVVEEKAPVVEEEAPAAAEAQRPALAEEQRKIHGSVSTTHIAQQIREMMLLDPEAARIQLAPEDVTFVGAGEEEAHNNKVEKIGTYEVKIRAHAGKVALDPVWRTIEVVPNRDEADTSA